MSGRHGWDFGGERREKEGDFFRAIVTMKTTIIHFDWNKNFDCVVKGVTWEFRITCHQFDQNIKFDIGNRLINYLSQTSMGHKIIIQFRRLRK